MLARLALCAFVAAKIGRVSGQPVTNAFQPFAQPCFYGEVLWRDLVQLKTPCSNFVQSKTCINHAVCYGTCHKSTTGYVELTMCFEACDDAFVSEIEANCKRCEDESGLLPFKASLNETNLCTRFPFPATGKAGEKPYTPKCSDYRVAYKQHLVANWWAYRQASWSKKEDDYHELLRRVIGGPAGSLRRADRRGLFALRDMCENIAGLAKPICLGNDRPFGWPSDGPQ